jgi:hypothetical protein
MTYSPSWRFSTLSQTTSQHHYPEALGLYWEEEPQWLPHPWYHDKDLSSHLPEVFLSNKCAYCHSLYHAPPQCLCPHSLCDTHLSCIIPTNHSAYMGACLHAHYHIQDDDNDAYNPESNMDPNPYSDNREA